MSDTWTRGHTSDTRRIRVRYATWRIIDYIVGQPLPDTARTQLDISDQIPIGCVEDEGERRWEAVAGSSRREKGEDGREKMRIGGWSKRGGWVPGEWGESRGQGVVGWVGVAEGCGRVRRGWWGRQGGSRG